MTEPRPDTEPEPEEAALAFGDRIELARAFASDLAERGEPLGLIGPAERGRLWSRHILNCAAVAPLLGHGVVGDVGSGAGLPGIVLAIAVPRARFVLIEPMERRVAWLEEQVRNLGLDNVQVLRSRAEDVHLSQPLDQVTARAVASFRRLIAVCAPLVREGGELVLMKGRNAEEEVAAASKEIRKYRLTQVEVVEVGRDLLDEPTRVIRARVGLAPTVSQ